ncbi:hypothetical protein IGI04_038145 [Brassica rapa subsp. trilocularis]|uniref:RBR-type E3 ubiquitin transferase n=1 Tax=Brassica rapa subsp. trilocularis TaxID=1813537 RepID=A0ABQ7LL07_BRACM|nr:hypothetical protein IGI04_038145 [Brassica rapa subsp. trilocularis]
MEESHCSDLISKRQRLDSYIAGDITNPKGEGSSKLVQFADNVVYRLYFKGLVSDEVAAAESGERTVTAGFGVAICDVADNLLYEMKESLSGGGEVKRRGVEIRALIHGLSEAFNMGIRHVRIHCDDYPIFQFINGGDKPKQNDMRQLVNEVCRLKEKMNSCEPLMVARNDVKFAFKLAREAIVSQGSSLDLKAAQGTTCAICLEETDAGRMFSTEQCLHRHCFSCVKQYVEVKLLSGIVPTCLGEGCKLELTLESCSKILTPRVTEMWKRKMKEDSIPAAERIYCPYPNCAMLMSKSDLSSHADQSKVQECVKCRGHFCIDCKVPSHTDMSCDDYDMSPVPPGAVQEYEAFVIEEGNDDEYDDYNNYGGLTESDNDGGFEDFYRDYYSL